MLILEEKRDRMDREREQYSARQPEGQVRDAFHIWSLSMQHSESATRIAELTSRLLGPSATTVPTCADQPLVGQIL